MKIVINFKYFLEIYNLKNNTEINLINIKFIIISVIVRV